MTAGDDCPTPVHEDNQHGDQWVTDAKIALNWFE